MQNVEELFNDSYARIMGRESEGRDFFDAFFEDFFTRSPMIREKFKETDLDDQKVNLRQSLLHLMAFFSTKSIDSELERIARIHSKSEHDITPDLYEVFTDSLISTLRTFDPLFDDNIELAWRVVLAPGIEFMKFRYGNPEDGAR